MSLRYGEVARQLWRQPWFRSLSDRAKIVYLALLTGPIATSLPGLVEADVFMVASVAAMTADQVGDAFAELTLVQAITVDAPHSLVMIDGQPPAEDPIRSFKQLLGWWANFEQLPPSPLKLRHVEALRRAVDFAVEGKPSRDGKQPIPSMRETWDRTFGRLPVDTLHERVSDTPSHTLPYTPSIPATATATVNEKPTTLRARAGSTNGGPAHYGIGALGRDWERITRQPTSNGASLEALLALITKTAAIADPPVEVAELAPKIIAAAVEFFADMRRRKVHHGTLTPALLVDEKHEGRFFAQALDRIDSQRAGAAVTPQDDDDDLPTHPRVLALRAERRRLAEQEKKS